MTLKEGVIARPRDGAVAISVSRSAINLPVLPSVPFCLPWPAVAYGEGGFILYSSFPIAMISDTLLSRIMTS